MHNLYHSPIVGISMPLEVTAPGALGNHAHTGKHIIVIKYFAKKEPEAGLY